MPIYQYYTSLTKFAIFGFCILIGLLPCQGRIDETRKECGKLHGKELASNEEKGEVQYSNGKMKVTCFFADIKNKNSKCYHVVYYPIGKNFGNLQKIELMATNFEVKVWSARDGHAFVSFGGKCIAWMSPKRVSVWLKKEFDARGGKDK